MMKKKQPVIIIGAGAHSKVITDIIEQSNEYLIKGFVDKCRNGVWNYPIIGNDEDLPLIYCEGIHKAFIAIGDNYENIY